MTAGPRFANRTRVAFMLLVAGGITCVLLTVSGRTSAARVLALAEIDIVWMTLLVTGIALHRRGIPILQGWLTIARSLPPEPVRNALRAEREFLISAFRVMCRRPPRVPSAAIAVAAKKGTVALPVAFATVTVIEIVVVHLVLPWQSVATILTLASIYGMLLLFGIIATRWQHPHYVTDSELVLRNGTHVIAAIPREDILRVQVQHDGTATSPVVEGAVAKLPTMEGSSVSISFREPLHLRLTRSARETEHAVSEVRIAADDPRGVVAALSGL